VRVFTPVASILLILAVLLNLRFCFSDCGDLISHGSTNVPLSDCNFQCTGDSSEICGAGNRLNMYWSGATPPPPPEVVPSVGLWESLGCYT
jgi:hypothetical protein